MDFSKISKKEVSVVLVEAIVVGVSLIALFMGVDYLSQYIPDLTNTNKLWEKLFIAGFLFHLLFEYSGVNLWYALQYCGIQ
jgi:hypothetical protein